MNKKNFSYLKDHIKVLKEKNSSKIKYAMEHNDTNLLFFRTGYQAALNEIELLLNIIKGGN